MLRFNYSVEEISGVFDRAVKNFEERINEIVSIDGEKRTFENTVKSFEDALANLEYEINIPVFLSYVAEDPEIRKAAGELEVKAGKYYVDIFTREDIFKAISEYSKKGEALDETDKRLMDKILFLFKQNGLYGDADTRRKVKKLLKRLVEIEHKYSKNLRETRDFVELTMEELKGMDENFIKRLEKTKDGKYIVSTDYPDYLPFMDNAENDNARKMLEMKFNNRCYPENVDLLEKAIRIRRRIARHLGYETFADYVLEDRMAKNSENVMEFLRKLRKEIKRKARREIGKLIKMRNEKEKVNDNTLYNWQWRYYANLFKKNYSLDHEKIREYFQLEVVIKGMFEIFEKVFSVRFVESELEKWHKDVRSYEVKNFDNKTIAYFYFDLFPRDGKYKHAACFGIVKGRELADGSYRKPVAAIVANFTPPVATIPSLLKFDEVVTLFHEFGHVMHNILTKSRYQFFAGTSVARDFVEVPSQMLENWAYDPSVLKKISSHYLTKEPLPDLMIDRIILLKNLTSGIFYSRQLFFASCDMTYHTRKGRFDSTEIYKKLMKIIFLIPMTEGTHPQASFGHIMGGYEAGYYSYLWSEVISCEFFEEFKKNGLFNPEIGRKYVENVLSKGGSVDEEKMTLAFIGRNVSILPFLKHIGVK